MKLATTTQSNLEDHLTKLGLKYGDDIIVHSALINFGVIDGGVKTVYQAIRNIIGQQATIVVPTYMLGAAPNETYDPDNSPSMACGSFSEYVRKKRGSIRSLCPLHNHTAIGPKAELLRQINGEISLGRGSDFDILHKENFLTLLLGCPFKDGATFIMHLEAVALVPFRSWVSLSRKVIMPDGTISLNKCAYYQRNKGVVENLAPVKVILEDKGYIKSAQIHNAKSYLISKKAYRKTLEAFRFDPNLTLS